MSASSPGSHTLSPWWALALLPLGLLAGWLVGRLPGSVPAPVPTRPASANAERSIPARDVRGVATPAAARPEAQADASPAAESPAEPPRDVAVSEWSTLDRAMAEAGRNGKPIFIDFNAEWCGPCQRLRQQVFENAVLGHAVQAAVIPVSIVDRAREDGSNPPDIATLQQRFGVRAFPTLVVFSPQTGRVVKTEGFGDPQATVTWIEDAARSVR